MCRFFKAMTYFVWRGLRVVRYCTKYLVTSIYVLCPLCIVDIELCKAILSELSAVLL